MKKTIALILMSGLALAGCSRSTGNNASNAAATINAAAPAANNSATAANSTNSAAPTGGTVTPAAFREMLTRDGARASVQTLSADPSSPTLQHVQNGIRSGNGDWLAVVPFYSTGTDASTSNDLKDALSEALSKNAAGVLRVMGDAQTSSFLKENLCMAPEMEPGPELTAYLDSATRAVEAVNDSALSAQKTTCLNRLREARG